MFLTLLTIALIILAGICNSFMDGMAFKFTQTILAEYLAKGSPGAKVLSRWLGSPADTFENKNGHKNPVLRWLFRNPLVFLTDSWHFFQFLTFSFFQLAIIIHLPDLVDLHRASNIALWFILIKIIYGSAFEGAATLLIMTQDKRKNFLSILRYWFKPIGIVLLLFGFSIPAAMYYELQLQTNFWIGFETTLVVLTIVAFFLFHRWTGKRGKSER